MSYWNIHFLHLKKYIKNTIYTKKNIKNAKYSNAYSARLHLFFHALFYFYYLVFYSGRVPQAT